MRNQRILTAIFIGSLAVSLCSMAGLQSIDRESVTRKAMDSFESRGVDTSAAWIATVARAAGAVISPKFTSGDRFVSIDLNPKEVCQISITGPQIRPGMTVKYYAPHGGRIEGEMKGVLAASNNGTLEFEYQVGSHGAHPLNITIGGKKISMQFRVVSKSKAESSIGEAR